MDPMYTFEVAITLFVQGLGSWLALPMRAFTFLGQEDFFMLILPVLYWSINPVLGIRVGAILMLSGSINGYLKAAFHGPRPYWYTPQVKPFAYESSFGMPSGHAQNAISVWGIIGSFFRSTWAKVITGLVIFFIGISRIYLGVHFTSDVLVGWLAGGLLLLALLRWEAPIIAWAKRLSFAGQVLLTFISSLVLIGINVLVLAIFGGWEVPQVWILNAALANPEELIAPFSPTGIITNAGTWFGLFTGVAWLWRRGVYSANGTLEKRILRYVIGALGVAVLYFGLGQIFPRTDDLPGYILRYIRYSLVGLWISAAAPMVFIRLKLAEGLHRPVQTEERQEALSNPVQAP